MDRIFGSLGFGQGHNLNRQQSNKAEWYDNLKAIPSPLADRTDIDKGNKILLPASVLNIYNKYNVPQPLIFCIQNQFLNKQAFVGVLEFVASDGTCVLPQWLFNSLGLEIYQQVMVCLNTEVPKGRFVKIQPHETEFVNLPDPQAIMEVQFRNYTCLTEGETISISFHDKQYLIDIIEIRPQNNYKTVSLLDTNLEVDFAPPKDYEEYLQQHKLQKSTSVKLEEDEQAMVEEGWNPFKGSGQRLDGKPINANQRKSSNDQTFRKSSVDVNNVKNLQNQLEEYDPRKHRLINGVRSNLLNNEYQGQGVQLGQSKKK